MAPVPPHRLAKLHGDGTLDNVIPARAAELAPVPADLRPELAAALAGRGIERLYRHQAEAYAQVRGGRHVVAVTPTASGKTLCYNLPVLQGLLERPASRALYVFPTKALAQDQLAELGALTAPLPLDVKVSTYDGDTPPGQRTAIREGGHIVLTNPDMLHTGVLPHHTRWRRLFSSLEHVVIDELHTYRGLFGSQVANVIRRLKRICEFYGSSPRFICASATIANPRELAERLLEEEGVALVDRSGAPRGERRLVFYNPPLVNRELGIRRSSLLEGRRIATPWVRDGVQTIVFCRSRLQVEVMLSYLREPLLPRREEGLGDRDNLRVLAGRRQAGLFELPFLDGERFGGADVDELLHLFEEDGVVSRSGGRWFWSQDAFPAEGVSLRRMAADNVVIIDTSPARPEVIGEMDQFTAQVMLHEEAIYLQDGAQYHVDRLDWEEKKAYVRPGDVDYYTDAMLGVSSTVLDTFEHEPGDDVDRSHGDVKLTALPPNSKTILFPPH